MSRWSYSSLLRSKRLDPTHRAKVIRDADPALVRRIQSVVRFAVPWRDTIAVISGGNDELLDLEDRPAWHFPAAPGGLHSEHQPSDSAEAIAHLESLRTKGARFLLVPKTEFWWLDHYGDFQRHLESNYRIAARTDDCIIVALRWPSDADFRNTGAPDGLPLPPPELIRLTVANEDSEQFCRSGASGAEWIEALLRQHSFDISSVGPILDFGCGCGRVVRHWKQLDGVRIVGADYNPYLVDWCRVHLPFAEFQRTPLAPTLNLDDESFGLVYAISVLTHLDEEYHAACMAELSRILRRGGLLLLTVHTSMRLERMTPSERALFDAGKIVVRRAQQSGSNACTTFHPEPYVRNVLAKELELRDFVFGGAPDVQQDCVLFQKPA